MNAEAARDYPTPDDGRVFAEAKVLLEQRNATESEALFRRLLSSPRYGADAAYGAGLARLSSGDLGAAASYFDECLQRDPHHANALYQLGFIAERQNASTEARSYYERALALNRGHVGAKRRLAQLPSRPPAPPRTEPTGIAPAAQVDQVYGVYEYLAQDASTLSQQTIAMMNELRTSVHPSLVAYAGRYASRFLVLAGLPLLVGAALLSGGVESLLATHLAVYVDSAALTRLWVQLVGSVALAFAAIGTLRVLCTRVTIDRGRLQIHKGVLARRLLNVELWRVRNIELERTLVNRLTGHGTLVVHVTGDPSLKSRRKRRKDPSEDYVLELTGIARGRRLHATFQNLLNLVFLLRSNPLAKGIIQ
jgi:membrane protein YdbS with pleckstrin-like domain